MDFPDDARACAYVDWDFDGDLDFWFSNRTAPQVRFLRNELPSHQHFLAVSLAGTVCNRDAIGARVEVHLQGDSSPLIRSLKAGSGYLSQSTKWLHFGLGASPVISQVIVKWPGGEAQNFGPLEANRHYTLTQGKSASVWTPNRSAQRVPQPVSLPPSTQQARVFSTTRLPVPRLEYESTEGAVVPLDAGHPTLLVLWASWCQPCVEELAELVKRKSELEELGLRVLALSVDKLDKEAGSSEKAVSLMQRIGFPYTYGFATRDTTAKLQLTHDFLFLLQKPLPIPTSFLVDEQYRLAAIYRGPLEPNRVLDDLSNLDLTIEGRRDASIPFLGRWIGKPKTLRLAPFVIELARAGYLVDASEYVQRMQNQFDQATILDLVVRLGIDYHESEMPDHANLHFRMARQIRPGTLLPELRLAEHLKGKRDYAGAVRLLKKIVEQHPRNTQARNKLAWILATCPDRSIHDPKQAQQLVVPLLHSSPISPSALDTVAAVLASESKFEEAVEVARKAEAAAHQAKLFRLEGDIRRRIHRYQQQDAYSLP